MSENSLLKKAVRKFQREGIPGVYHATMKRIHPLIKGMLRPKAKKNPYSLLYVIGCAEGESQRYRVYNLIEALLPLGIFAEAAEPAELPFLEVNSFSLVIFFRCEYSSLTASFLKKCVENNVPTVYDVDDLVFDPSIVEQIAAYQEMLPADQEMYKAGVASYLKMLQACDYATASTEYLVSYITQLTGKEAFRIPNGLNKAQIGATQKLPQSRPKREIGFLSGSKTHQKDFERAAPALARILKKYPDVTLTVVGFLDLPEALQEAGAQVQLLPFMEYEALLKLTASLYAVIIPLEYETDFCQAKSELKFFEQALVRVPVIASPTEVYQSCIEDGVNGFLAYNDKDWEEKLITLLEDPALRDAMGERAFHSLQAVYYPAAIGARSKEAYDTILLKTARKRMDVHKLKISFVIPEPCDGSGGHRNIFRIARAFAQMGHQVTIYTDGFNGLFLSDAALKQFVAKKYFNVDAEFRLGCSDIQPCDLLIATQWHTAYVVKEFRHRCVLPCYFIQDFEPYFYPMGEEYIQAYDTYSWGFTSVSSGKWASNMVERISGLPCPYFVFPLQREIYREDKNVIRESNTVLFFARPQMPRRCYMLGVEALRLLKEQNPAVRIVFYGADARDYGDYGFEYEKAGLLRGPDELAMLYRQATVGLCFSLTNPSLVPFEMMACGLPVIDLDFRNSQISYGGNAAALLVQTSAKSVAEGIQRLLHDPKERDDRRAAGRKLVSQMPTEEEVGGFVARILLEELTEKSR